MFLNEINTPFIKFYNEANGEDETGINQLEKDLNGKTTDTNNNDDSSDNNENSSSKDNEDSSEENPMNDENNSSEDNNTDETETDETSNPEDNDSNDDLGDDANGTETPENNEKPLEKKKRLFYFNYFSNMLSITENFSNSLNNILQSVSEDDNKNELRIIMSELDKLKEDLNELLLNQIKIISLENLKGLSIIFQTKTETLTNIVEKIINTKSSH